VVWGGVAGVCAGEIIATCGFIFSRGEKSTFTKFSGFGAAQFGGLFTASAFIFWNFMGNASSFGVILEIRQGAF
jgi:hypothetical protein